MDHDRLGPAGDDGVAPIILACRYHDIPEIGESRPAQIHVEHDPDPLDRGQNTVTEALIPCRAEL